MENLEIEYKVMINKDGYETLMKYFENEGVLIDQTNYYFDSKDDIIKGNNISLRIRKINNTYIATLKEKLKEGNLETEEEIQDLDINLVSDSFKQKLRNHNVDINNIYNKYSLRTIRYEIKLLEGLLCIDYSIYNKIEDYELECESTSLKKAKEVIETLLLKLNINFEESKYTKQARARLSL